MPSIHEEWYHIIYQLSIDIVRYYNTSLEMSPRLQPPEGGRGEEDSHE